VAKLMVEYNCGEIPVVESMETLKPVGVITDRDITCRAVAQGKNPLEMIVAECMSSPCVTVTPETSLEECCRVLEQHQIRRVPVVDNGGILCGMVSQADIATCAPNERTAEVVREVSQPTKTASRGSPSPVM
jgi:CBS domain-containing protein